MWRTLYHLQLVLEMKKKFVAKLFPDHALNLKRCERGAGGGASPSPSPLALLFLEWWAGLMKRWSNNLPPSLVPVPESSGFLVSRVTTGITDQKARRLWVWDCLPPVWPGLTSRSRCHTQAKLAVSFWLVISVWRYFFSMYPSFLVSSKNGISKFQFDIEGVSSSPKK